MKEIHTKTVFGDDNRPVEVIISYDDWKEIKAVLGANQRSISRGGLKKYRGILKLKEDPLAFQERIRNEWH